MVLVIATVGMLLGCMMPRISLKEPPSGVPVFSVQDNYEIVFDRISRQARQCYEPKGRIISARLYREDLRAEVTISIPFGKSTRRLFTATILAESASLTIVNTHYTYSPPGNWRDGAYAIQRWASGEENYCGRD